MHFETADASFEFVFFTYEPGGWKKSAFGLLHGTKGSEFRSKDRNENKNYQRRMYLYFNT